MKKNKNHKTATVYNADIFANIDNLISTSPSKHIIVPNVCSKMNKITSGFSRELYKKYPSVMADVDINNIPKNLCTYSVAYRHPHTKALLIVANMYCQENINTSRLIHYGQLVFCMYEIKKKIHALKEQFPDFSTEIHCSRFGTGISGGNWQIISELINDIWSTESVFIYNKRIITQDAY